jgi:hypothetical protein
MGRFKVGQLLATPGVLRAAGGAVGKDYVRGSGELVVVTEWEGRYSRGACGIGLFILRSWYFRCFG